MKIGLFDSGIGGFSVLKELFTKLPFAELYYFSDDAYAPYGPLTDEKITERAKIITEVLLQKGVQLIVIACNTATAASIDELRRIYPHIPFVGVEPYLNAYYKEQGPAKMAVLTTESMGKSERFKRLKDRIDPTGAIANYSLKYLAKLVEDLYYSRINKDYFSQKLLEELKPLEKQGFTHVILGCTHYPLVRNEIEKILNVKALSPCPYVASRVYELLNGPAFENKKKLDTFYFYSSQNQQWVERIRNDLLSPLT